MKESRARSPVPWFGGKQRLAEQIVSVFPPHESYVEVFGGGASVLLTKSPASLEIYNDRDDGEEDHAELVDTVLGLQGIAIVSGYDSPLYDRLVTEGGFDRQTFQVWSTAGRRDGGNARDRRTEVLWISPRADRMTLFTHVAGA